MSEWQTILLGFVAGVTILIGLPLGRARRLRPGLRTFLNAASAGVLRVRPADHEWSVLEVAAHLLDAEVFSSGRYRWVLGHERPDLPGYDQDLVANASHNDEADPEVVLSAFTWLRRANLDLWARATPDQRARESFHVERGVSSYEMLFREKAGHDRFHLAQMDRTFEAVRGA